MSPKLLYLSSNLDPYFNLAFEEWMIREGKSAQSSLFIWQSAPSMVMGRFQNPWKECELELMKTDNINLVRRASGGGCVFHDLGNLNFTFFHPSRNFHKEQNIKFMLNFLKDLGFKNIKEGLKSDLLISIDGQEKKISGSAFKQTRDYSYHHLSLLVDSNLDQLNKYIKQDYSHISDKSINSRRTQVANLSDSAKINIRDLKQSLIRSFDKRISIDSNLQSKLKTYMDKLKDPQWIFYSGPSFIYSHSYTHSNSKENELKIEVKKGGEIKGIYFEGVEYLCDPKHKTKYYFNLSSVNQVVNLILQDNGLSPIL